MISKSTIALVVCLSGALSTTSAKPMFAKSINCPSVATNTVTTINYGLPNVSVVFDIESNATDGFFVSASGTGLDFANPISQTPPNCMADRTTGPSCRFELSTDGTPLFNNRVTDITVVEVLDAGLGITNTVDCPRISTTVPVTLLQFSID